MYGLFELIRHKKEETQMRIFPIVAVWIAGHFTGPNAVVQIEESSIRSLFSPILVFV